MMNKTVVISALHFPLTMARYMWEALEDRDDVEVWSTGPFYNNWIPWGNGMTLDQRYVKTPDLPLPPANIPYPAKLIDQHAPKHIDLWLNIDAGWCVEGRPSNVDVYAQIQTDPHVLKDRYRKYRGQHDISFCMQTPYMDEGEIYLPYGYSKRYHYFEEVEHKYDVCLIGLNYTHRNDLLGYLRSNRSLVTKSGIGIVYDDYRREYCASTVALSWSSLLDTPARFYEALAMRVPLVTNRTPDIAKNGFVDGVDFCGFDTIDEAGNKVWELIQDKEYRFMVVNNGYEKVQGCSWDDRMKFVMKECGLL